jgi:hypothetical protein
MQRGGRRWSPLSGRSHCYRGRWPSSSREEAVINVPWGRHCAPHRRDLGEDAHEASRRGRRSRTLGFGWPMTPPPVRARRRRRRASLALSSVRARRHHATPWQQSWPPPLSETRPPPAAGCLRLHEREREGRCSDEG